MKTWICSILCIATALILIPQASAQRQMEDLGRGVVAVRASSTEAYVGWRLLATDPDAVGFNVYRVRSGITNQLNGSPITSSCNLVDTPPNFNVPIDYVVRPVLGGVEQPGNSAFTLPASAPTRQYLSVPLQVPAGGTSPDSVPYVYSPNDCSVADLDGDGNYEIVVKWDPSNAHDNAHEGYTGNVLLDAYELDGTHLWRIDLGINIRAGAHYTQFMVYDLDGDGLAEVVCKTAEGSQDGLGAFVANNSARFTGAFPTVNNAADHRNSSGRILKGYEFLTVFKGDTGEELATTYYNPPRNNDVNSTDVSAWGDNYGNRVDRFLACVAYLDGNRPSVVMCRGYYTRAVLAAWDWRDGQLTQRWVFDSDDGTPGNLAYRGEGAHSLTVGDVDCDGRDEITYGACAIDDDGTGLYATGIGHGDALHMSDMDPARGGLEVWMVHECPSCYGPNGLEMRDAHSGSVLFNVDGQNSDVGRGVAIDIDPNYPGYEMWGARGGLMNASGQELPFSRPDQMNFAVYWDADLNREILDGTTISKYDPADGSVDALSLSGGGGLSSNNGTKSTPALSVDLFGDWREEVIWRTSSNGELRIFTTTDLATNRIPTLMHDPQYRLAIAWQNVAYNQPPHPGFYIGPDMATPPRLPVSDADLVWRGNAGSTWDVSTTASWFTNGLWVGNNTPTVFNAGDTVLFDDTGSNASPIHVSGTVSPAGMTVFASDDYTFAGGGSLSGTMALVKAGCGTLTLNNGNGFTGETRVGEGGLFVNGSLSNSPVIVERRATVGGFARVGGQGTLGAGLEIHRGCGLIVGPDTNAAGTLTVSGSLSEAGEVLNQFDLSDDPSGVSKASDRVEVTGDLTVSGLNTIRINQLDGILGDGVYPLIEYSGAFVGNLENFVLSGEFAQPVVLTNPPGQIALLSVVPAASPVAPTALSATPVSAFQIDLSWTDNSGDENGFLIERSLDNLSFALITVAAPGETTYQDTPLMAGNTYYYRVSATNLAGTSGFTAANATTTTTAPTLTWVGDGSANGWDVGSTANWWNSAPSTYADGAHVIFDNTGSSSPAVNILESVAPGSVTVSSSQDYIFAGSGMITGTAPLVKDGSGMLTINAAQGYSGGTVISNGTVKLGNDTANELGLGTGTVTLQAGLLIMNNSSSSYTPAPWDLHVPSGATGQLNADSRCDLTGSLTGGGQFTFRTPWVRPTVYGDWSAFSGWINVTADGDGGDFRVANAAGFPAARVHLADNVYMYSRAGNGAVIPIGEFSADAGATVSAGSGSSEGVQHAVTWRVGGLNTDTTNAASFVGTTALIKEGTGRCVLTATSDYSGSTTVNAGTLVVNGTLENTSVNVIGGALGGNGVMGGMVTIQAGGTLAPGASIGTLTVSNTVTLDPDSLTLMEISKLPLENDVLVTSGTLTVGGTLVVTHVGGGTLSAGDSFALFSAPLYSGTFATVDLPPLGAALGWDTGTLLTDGTIEVVNVPQPVITGLVESGGDLTVTGSGGMSGGTYRVLSSSDLELPLSLWMPVQTNSFDGSGNFSFVITVDPNTSHRFHVVEIR